MTPRLYQRAALGKVTEAQAAGARRTVVYGPTGAGKTILAQTWAVEHPDRRMLFVCDRKPLIRQTAASFKAAGLPVGIIQANNTYRTSARVVVSSAQTLQSRPELMERVCREVDDLWIDECHLQREIVADAAAIVVSRGGRVVGMSATPFAPHLSAWDAICSMPSTTALQDLDYLVRAEVEEIWTPDQARLDAARRGKGGEWQDGEIEQIVKPHTDEIAALTLAAMERHGLADAPAIGFGATIDHVEALARSLSQASGRRWVAVSERTSDNAMTLILAEYAAGLIAGLLSVAKLAVGFDAPIATVALLNRPLSRSFAEHLQELGRVLRIAEAKRRALVVDASGNWGRFERATRQVWANGVSVLPRPRMVEVKVWFCRCGAENPSRATRCAACGRAKRHPEALPEPKTCSRCAAKNAGSAPICSECYQPFERRDGGLERCARHGLLLEADGDGGGTVCPMPGCDVGQPADSEVVLPPDEPLRTLFILACRSADRRGETGANIYFQRIVKEFTDGTVPKGLRAVAGTRASYELGDPRIERKVRQFNIKRGRSRRRRNA